MAIGELCFGFFVTPIIFLRGVLVSELPRSQQVRVWLEYAAAVALWCIALLSIHYLGWWQSFLVGYFAPAFLAGNLQSFRKFTEHMGLFGDSPLTATRTVTRNRLFGKVVSRSVLHTDHHGTHHRYGRLPYHLLPVVTWDVYRDARDAIPTFPNYTRAFLDMVPSLRDPRIGRQWLARSCKGFME
jgi:fatty acid desaturase